MRNPAKWTIKNKKIDMHSMVNTLGVSPVVIRSMVNRGIEDMDIAKKFLNPSIKDLNDTAIFKDIHKAIDIVAKYLKEGKSIAIYGDYDVDGVMSTTILHKALSPLSNGDLTYYIPHREKEGYGLNKNAITSLKDRGIDLIIACDNGITAIEEVEHANSLGVKMVILDHHESIIENEVEKLPPAYAVVNHKQTKCEYPFKHLCAGVICYKFINALYSYMNKEMSTELNNELMVFAGIATLCDVVELVDENRAIVALALGILEEGVTNIGLLQLTKLKKMELIDEEAIGFTIGPCINAAGRLQNASLAVELFVTMDMQRAKEIASELVELNEERKNVTKEAINAIIETLDESAIDNVIVAYNPNIHEAVAGIVAGRLKDIYYRPAIVLTMGESHVKGSARSIEGYDIYEGLAQFRHLYHRFGGHQMAAGLSLEEANVDLLRKGLNDNFMGDLQEVISIDMQLDIKDATYSLIKELEILKPFGKGNDQPLFATKKVKIIALKVMPEKNTIIFTFETGSEIGMKGLCFGETKKFSDMIKNNYDAYTSEKILGGVLRTAEIYLDILYYLDVNVYNGRTSVQLRIRDYRLS